MDSKHSILFYEPKSHCRQLTKSKSIKQVKTKPLNFSLSTIKNWVGIECSVEEYQPDGLFYDFEFAPKRESVFRGEKNHTFDLKWVRAEELTDSNKIYTSISPTEIKQGALGNCWFVAALSCLAEKPHLIERLFESDEIARDGKYAINLHQNGVPIRVEIDSLVPVHSDRKTLFGSRSTRNQIWVPLLEKAFSKAKGSYVALVNGECHEAFFDLTGSPSGSLDDVSREKNFFGFLKANVPTQRFLLTAAIDGSQAGHGYRKMHQRGLLVNHAYSLVGAKEHVDAKHGKVQLVQLRNPWSRFEWNGDYSDCSDKWDAELAADYQLCVDENDGLFWLDFEDFSSLFDTFSYCDETHAWATKSSTFEFEKTLTNVRNPYFSLTVPEGQTLSYISLHQRDSRNKANPQKYIDMAAFVLKEPSGRYADPAPVAFLDSSLDRSVLKKLDLPEGRYKIVPYTSGAHFAQTSRGAREASLVLHFASSDPGAGVAPALSVAGEKNAAEMMVDSKIAFVRAMGSMDAEGKNSFNVRVLTCGGLVLLGLEHKGAVDRDAEYLIDVRATSNMVPTLDSWQKESIQAFKMKREDGRKLVLVGSFIRSDNRKCHFGADVKCLVGGINE